MGHWLARPVDAVTPRTSSTPADPNATPVPLPTPLLATVQPVLLAVLRRRMLRTVRRTPFPRDEPVLHVPGRDPVRMLVVGELGASGLGVLLHGMAFPAQLAEMLAQRTDRGVRTTLATDPRLTLRAAVAHPALDVTERRDVAVVALGVPDVVRGTSRAAAVSALEELVCRVRRSSGPACAVVLCGPPPVGHGQSVPSSVRSTFDRRTRDLSTAMADVADRLDGVAFVAFPAWDAPRLRVRDAFSFRALHHLWADAVVPTVVAALDARGGDRAGSGGPALVA